jgi:uncharacterized membrane protein YdbT with pleckstrin-like domain
MKNLSDKSIVTNSLGTLFSVMITALFGSFFILALINDSDSGESVSAAELPLGIIVGVLVAAFILAILYSAFWVRLFGYEINDTEVKIEKGVIAKSYDSIPYSRIQNVGIERSLIERMLGISTVKIHTAGHSGQGSGAEGDIPGVEKTVASDLREKIMEKARSEDGGGL